MSHQQNRLQLGNQEVVFSVTSSDGATISTANGKELAIKVERGGIKMVKKDPITNDEESMDMKAKFESIDSNILTNQGEGASGISKDINDATAELTSVEEKLDTFQTNITTFHKKYNTQTDDTATPPTVADSTSVHRTQHTDIENLVVERTTIVNDQDTKMGINVDFIRDAGIGTDGKPENSNSIVELEKAVDAMQIDRIEDVAKLIGDTAEKLQTEVTDVVQDVETDLTEFFRACDGILCDDDTDQILKNIIDAINGADGTLRSNIIDFSRQTYALASDVKSLVSNISGVTATIDSPSMQKTNTPRIAGTLQMAAGRSFYLFFNSVAFDITPATNVSGSHNWVLDFSSVEDPPAQKKIYPDEVLVVRSGVSRAGDRNDLAVIEYAGDQKTLTQIAVVQKLLIDTLGPEISINAINPITRIMDMNTFTISGSVGEVGAKVEMIYGDGRKWEITTTQDGEYSFSPYVDVPVSGGTALPKSREDLTHTFRLEATDLLGNTSVTNYQTWTVILDDIIEEFTIETGTKYITNRPTFSGTVDAGTTVSLLWDTNLLEYVAGPDKAWSIEITEDLSPLPEGLEVSLIFTAKDTQGDERNLVHTAKVWTQDPVITVEPDVTTGSTSYSFTGVVSPAAGQQFGGVTSVELTVEDSNGVVLSNPVSITHTNVTLTGMLTLPEIEGKYVMKWKATNNFGISTTVSSFLTLDRTAPSLVITENPQLDKTSLIKVGGTWTDPGSDKVPTITVEVEGVVYKADNVVKNTNGNLGFWECVLQTNSGAAGTIENEETAISFVDKTYTVTATVTDGGGNMGTASGNMVVDSTAPTLSLNSTPPFQGSHDEYEVHISLLEPALKSLTLGVSTENVNLLNPLDHQVVSPVVQTNSGSIQEIVVKPNIVLMDQVYSVTVSATDIYDRITTRTIPIVIDTQAPHVTIVSTNLNPDDGNIDFSGTVQSANDSVEVSYQQRQGSIIVDTAFSPVIVIPDGISGTWAMQATNISYGDSFLRVRATDLAGNSGITYHPVVHPEPDGEKGSFIPAGPGVQQNPLNIHIDIGITEVTGVVTEFEDIDYIEAQLHGEYHRLEGQDLTDALTPVGVDWQDSWHPYRGNSAYRAISIVSGVSNPSYQSGMRQLIVGTTPQNIVSITVKWKGHAAVEPNWIVQQTYGYDGDPDDNTYSIFDNYATKDYTIEPVNAVGRTLQSFTHTGLGYTHPSGDTVYNGIAMLPTKYPAQSPANYWNLTNLEISYTNTVDYIIAFIMADIVSTDSTAFSLSTDLGTWEQNNFNEFIPLVSQFHWTTGNKVKLLPAVYSDPTIGTVGDVIPDTYHIVSGQGYYLYHDLTGFGEEGMDPALWKETMVFPVEDDGYKWKFII